MVDTCLDRSREMSQLGLGLQLISPDSTAEVNKQLDSSPSRASASLFPQPYLLNSPGRTERSDQNQI
jgi:hypothetical protein